MKLWNAANGQEMLTFTRARRRCPEPVNQPERGSGLASGGNDQTVKLWEIATGQETLTLSGHTGAVRSVLFSPDGTLLVSASDDKDQYTGV